MTTDIWLPFPADEIPGLPSPADSGFTYRLWDGEPEYPADPEDCVFYTVPYLERVETVIRPLSRMRSLRVVQTLSAGTDSVEAAIGGLHSGVRLCNARGVHEASTAELAIALVLASLRGLPRFVRGQDAEEWHAGFYPALADKSVLIVGYGAIGGAIAERLAPFECARVVRVARSARTTAHGEVRALSEMPSLLPEADIVILSTPLTDGTRGLVDAGFLARMKDGALLVNVARGAVVDTAALLAEVNRGRITAALDVTDPEPLPSGHPLWHAPGVLISPHVGGSTSAFLPRAKRLLAAQLQRLAAGDSPDHVVLTTE
ncbi:2-hydroxyacid dehydrogenase [Streptomyces clavuligerus]|nr:2-hydroxyacid dehydrogenase [Streptomyces clavuligerus]EDY52152.1 dehydrogenase [Streptomyces clavuligerus]MBY6302382.1 2-hydroxyacid dehydrogenase [Streptomyces clavuligerus]QPL62580.1 2-hydroxyacid dehydrogenase [Streptomyces clavuligerus]QPL68612.1 2-hydroxyacid dehydrogenase [Streptomyces clavuligerus]QPL74691.1 2-hydroxyacid dehydrogenase [Streptomyces clavuligerus]